MPVRYTPLAELPARIRDKIEVQGPNERTACWRWTASFVRARQRFAPPRTAEDRPDRGYDGREGRFIRQKATPLVHCTELGYTAPAYRVVFALCYGQSIRDVPKLSRCDDPACVSPWHTRPAGVIWREDALPRDAQPGSYSWDRCLTLLRQADVSTSHTPDTAADEAGIPRDQLTDACWQAYCAEVAAADAE